MSMKPGTLANFTPGKLIDTVRNCCATLNWMVSCWSSISGGDGISVSNVSKGAPKISAAIEGGGGVSVKRKKRKLIISCDPSIKVGDETGCKGIAFESAADSNLTFDVTKGSDGIATVKIGVYYVG